MGAVVPQGEETPEVKAFNRDVSSLCQQYLQQLEAIKIKDAIATVLQVSGVGNKFLQEVEPWKKTDPEERAVAERWAMAAALGLVKVLAAMLQPYMPSTTRAILKELAGPWEWTSLGESFEADCGALHNALPAGHKLGPKPGTKPAVLFTAISDDTVAALQQRFSGNQADAAAPASSASSKTAAPAKAAKGDTASSTAADGTANKGGGKATKAKADQSTAPAAAKGDQAVPKGEKAAKGEKPSKKAAAAPAADRDRPIDISRVDLRVGLITKADKHPDADSLYVESILCGEEEPRTVVSGLVKHVAHEDMQYRRVIVIANLKPANLKGIKSYAMVLAATDADGKVELVDPPKDTQPGDRVYVEGYEGEPDKQMNPKHKIFEAVTPDLKTNDDLVACYKGVPLMTAAGACTVCSVKNATIK